MCNNNNNNDNDNNKWRRRRRRKRTFGTPNLKYIVLSAFKFDTYIDVKSSSTKTHTRTHARTHPPHTHTHTGTTGQWGWRKFFGKESGFEGRLERTDRGCVTDRSGELAPCSCSSVQDRALTTGLCANEWYSEQSDVCRRTELLRGSVKLKNVWEVGGGLIWNDFKTHAQQRELVLNSLLNRKPVKRVKLRGYVGRSWGSENMPGSIVLDVLKFWKKILWAACQKGVTVI